MNLQYFTGRLVFKLAPYFEFFVKSCQHLLLDRLLLLLLVPNFDKSIGRLDKTPLYFVRLDRINNQIVAVVLRKLN